MSTSYSHAGPYQFVYQLSCNFAKCTWDTSLSAD